MAAVASGGLSPPEPGAAKLNEAFIHEFLSTRYKTGYFPSVLDAFREVKQRGEPPLPPPVSLPLAVAKIIQEDIIRDKILISVKPELSDSTLLSVLYYVAF